MKRWAVAAVAVVLLAGCGGSDEGVGDAGADRPDDARELELRPEREPTTTTTAPEDTALDDVLIEDAPEGFERADEEMGAGPLDLQAAAEAEADVEAERALLETRHFERGRTRAWLDAEGRDVVYVAVYEFAGPDDAALYLADGTETLTARGATTFEVPEVEGATGFTTVDENEAGAFTAHAVAFVRGDRWFLVLAGSPDSAITPDTARQLARAQADRAEAQG